MKHFILIVLTTFFANDTFAQGLTKNGKETTNGSEYVNKNGAIGSTDGINKNGEIVLAGVPIITVTSSTGRVWMDRNLGATQVATSSTDAASYGDLYQWGRGTDGHQIRTSTTTSTLSSIDAPGHANFITTPAPPNDWHSPKNDNLWQGISGVNNPCPSGFRLPTIAELTTEKDSWSTQDIDGAFASALKLPAAGNRTFDGGIEDEGIFGYYWSSDINLTNSRMMAFYWAGVFLTHNERVKGFSVRCIKD